MINDNKGYMQAIQGIQALRLPLRQNENCPIGRAILQLR